MNEDVFYDTQWKNTRSIKYYQDFDWKNNDFAIQESAIRKELRSISKKAIDVLELGCGFGRVTKMVLEECDTFTYSAIDISNDQIKNAREYLGKLWYDNNIAPFVFDITKLYTIGRHSAYDLVIAAETLMHIRPKDIKHVIKLMVDHSRHDIISIDWNFDKVESDFCFIHDYHKLYTEAGAKLMNRIDLESIKQSIFHYRVEK